MANGSRGNLTNSICQVKERVGSGTRRLLRSHQEGHDVFADQIKTSTEGGLYLHLHVPFSSLRKKGEVFSWQRYAEGGGVALALSAMLALASVFSIVSAILVVLPRKSTTSTTLFWGAWSAIATASSERRRPAIRPISSANMPRMRTRLRRSPAANTAVSASLSVACW